MFNSAAGANKVPWPVAFDKLVDRVVLRAHAAGWHNARPYHREARIQHCGRVHVSRNL